MAGIVEDFKIDHQIHLSTETMIFVAVVVLYLTFMKKR